MRPHSFVRCLFKKLIQRPAGSIGNMSTHSSDTTEEAHCPSFAGRSSSWNGNQPLPATFYLTTMFVKTAFRYDKIMENSTYRSCFK